MFTADIIKRLKQNDISKDPAKTKARVKEVFSKQSNAKKREILALAACSSSVVNRSKANGNISIKLAFAIAQTANVSPFYLTGESDEIGVFKLADAKELLKTYGYSEIVRGLDGEAAPVKQKRGRKKLSEIEPAAITAPAEDEPEREAAPEPARRGRKPKSLIPEANAVPEDEEEETSISFELSPGIQAVAAELEFEEATGLLRALFIRAKAGGNAERLLNVVKYSLLS